MLDFRHLGFEDGRSTELRRSDQVEDLHNRGVEYFNTLAIIIIITTILLLLLSKELRFISYSDKFYSSMTKSLVALQ